MKIFYLLILLTFTFKAYAEDMTDKSVDITSNTLEVTRQSGLVVFTGDVKALYQNMTLKSDVLTVIYDNKSKAKNKIKNLTAEGNVFLEQGVDTVVAKKAEYLVAKKLIVFTGNVVLNRNGNILEGDYLTMDTVTKKAKMKSNAGSKVKAVYFKPENKDAAKTESVNSDEDIKSAQGESNEK